jgi:amidophosphoribosyltransferase
LHLRETVGRHVNTDSDSELLLNLFAEGMTKEARKTDPVGMSEAIFSAMTTVMSQVRGGYAGLYLVNGFGLVGFRDPHGIRPLVFGCRTRKDMQQEVEIAVDNDGVPMVIGATDAAVKTMDYVFSSESVAIDTLGFKLVRYVLLELLRRRIRPFCTSSCCHSLSFSAVTFDLARLSSST